MKFLVFSTLLALAMSRSLDGVNEDDLAQWKLFKIEHKREYVSLGEEQRRIKNFMKNLDFVREHNAKYEKGEETFTVAINQFSDMTAREFAEVMNGYKRLAGPITSVEDLGQNQLVNRKLPKAVDWRGEGAVTAVKDQGRCGSCWAFSATGSLEGQIYNKTKILTSLSEQNLIDCSQHEGNQGCNGGFMVYAFNYIKKNNGIDTAYSYPYEGSDGPCRYSAKNNGGQITGYRKVIRNEVKLQEAVAGTPVSVAIDASHQTFMLYKDGVYKEPKCSSTRLDHAVLVVGYGNDEKAGAYWMVKNSWGATWGKKGYIMLARNLKNMCGIATEASYPTV